MTPHKPLTSGLTGLSSRSFSKTSLYVTLGITTLALLFVGGAFADSPEGSQAVAASSETSLPESPDPQSDKPLKASDRERQVVKVIPDLKAMYGTPNTKIDLRTKFPNADGASAKNVHFEVLHNTKEKVAKVEILDNHKLNIVYGKTGKAEVTVRATYATTGEQVDTRFRVKVWVPDYFRMFQTVIGGLAIFLLGMKSMSEGLQAVAGGGLRRMISAVTSNRFHAAGVGTAVTMLVQSSSITTVMVVGFVNSGFMTLRQAIGVVMGANIGTTITGWILVLKIGKYGLPILGVAAFVYLFTRREKIRYLAMAIMGVGMVFFGLELMKDGFSMVKDLPDFERWFHQFQAEDFSGRLKCALVGCVLTILVQSSSATLGITITLAAIGVIPFHTAAALVLGENIGTTVTAFLASFGATTNAKRAAYFHVIFNLLGVFWILSLFWVYMPIIEYFVPEDQLTARIALTHTGFNVINTLLFLPFIDVFTRLLMRFIPEKQVKEKPHLTSLDIRMLETPVIGIEQSRIEILRMGEGCSKMLHWLRTITETSPSDEKLVQKTFHREEVLDTIHDEVVTFMTDLLASDVPHAIVDEARHQLRIADEFESVSDYLATILKSHLKLEHANLRFTDEEQKQIDTLHSMCEAYHELIASGFRERQPDIITKAKSQGVAITSKVKELRDEHLKHLSQQKVDPQLSVAFTAQLNAYRRVGDHLLNVAEALAGEK